MFDIDKCTLDCAVRLFLKERDIQMHTTTTYFKTENSNIKRLQETLKTFKLRINRISFNRLMEADKENINLALEESLF